MNKFSAKEIKSLKKELQDLCGDLLPKNFEYTNFYDTNFFTQIITFKHDNIFYSVCSHQTSIKLDLTELFINENNQLSSVFVDRKEDLYTTLKKAMHDKNFRKMIHTHQGE